jgi:predicted lysophospholipase L1 biosynthesis ABC-type transport system permease subunit
MTKHMRVILACLMLAVATMSTVTSFSRTVHAEEDKECKEDDADCKK